jgi:putative ABC transport system ATP-binding protein
MSPAADPHIVEKIPFFHGLSLNQVRQILHAGATGSFEEGHVLCKDGDKSTSMFILLSGELSVKVGDEEIARVQPVDIVGEMGAVTSEPRCATILAARESAVMVIGKMQFDVLLKNDLDMAAKVYKNMLGSISHKLRENNARLLQRHAKTDEGIVASVV